MTNKVFYICGASASGKTSFSVELAKYIPNAVFINADTMQLYKGMEPLAAHPTSSEMAQIDNRLFGILELSQNISRSEWLDMAKKEIKKAFKDGKQPILIGGSRSSAASLAQAAYGIELDVNQKKEPTFPVEPNKKLDFPYPLYTITLMPSGKDIEKNVLKRLKQNREPSLNAITKARENGYTNFMPGMGTIGVKEYSDLLDGKTTLPQAEKRIVRRGINYIEEQQSLFSELARKIKLQDPLKSLAITSSSLDERISKTLNFMAKIKVSENFVNNQRANRISI